MNELELFHFHLERAIYIFNFQDKQLIETWINQLNHSLETDYIEACLTAAILELSSTHSDTFHWIVDNLTDCKACVQLLEAVTRFALKKLIQHGFIPGQDFSFTADGKILLMENTKNLIIQDAAPTDGLLLEKVLLTPQQNHLFVT
ncbi:hypothetical protein [Nostoc sp. TCL26-01]|uniref:hypothetical protein n=1 Tax=Nostoc sp. TCL26-01 TaxID=2576904 RepID=UPI0015BC1DA7|nr:hypothetical protein [Nostoc sp. TCL26-01]QLE57913.1 hypothetical protein FD725_21775 [Nostoc sp. TCL26-01]